MKKILRFFKWTAIVLASIIVVFSIVVASRQHLKYDAPYPDIKASTDSSVIARGEYLVYGPAHCVMCHVTNDKIPLAEKGEKLPLSGGYEFDLPVGKVYSKNITPDKETGIGNFTDGEIARTLRYGVGHDARAIFDFMPFQNLSDEDLTAVISYLRSMQPVHHKVPDLNLNLMGKMVNAFLVKPHGPEGEVPKKVIPAPTAEYGKYIANSIANCRGCHTNRDMVGNFIGIPFSGGLKMEVANKPGLFVVTPNLTPDPQTGHISQWSEDDFIRRFHNGKVIAESEMPWGPFGHMSDDDLRAIYHFLNSLEPVSNDPGPVLIVQK